MSLFPQTCGSTRYVTVSIHNHAQITVSKYSSFLVGNDCNTLHGNEGFPTEKVGQNVFFYHYSYLYTRSESFTSPLLKTK